MRRSECEFLLGLYHRRARQLFSAEATNMQDNAPQSQAQGRRKLSPIVAGAGAAMIAVAVTVVVMMSHPPTVATTTEQVATNVQQCPAMQRRLLVSTTHSGGTIQFRAGGYLSPPFTLTDHPQVVAFPLPRPETVPLQEIISIEGNATDVVITSELTDLHKVFDMLGTYPYAVTWAPRKGC
jgi:hypothetical protein